MSTTINPGFSFVDLFCGIGGFHSALSDLGGTCLYACDIDRKAADIYRHNWGLEPDGDIVAATTDCMNVPAHDVLVGGFPCQPFSKSGKQHGMNEARGTLFWNICRVLSERRPSVVVLENVRNVAGPRHRHEWRVMIDALRELGYHVADRPALFSPHLLPQSLGGTPQVRERVFITGTYVGADTVAALDYVAPDPVAAMDPAPNWDPHQWDLAAFLDDDPPRDAPRVWLSDDECRWITAWEEFVQDLRADGRGRLPGFPIWADHLTPSADLTIDEQVPAWKATFLRKNAALYDEHATTIDRWLCRWDGLRDFPPSRRKLEWQAQDASSLWDTIVHFRPSGLRARPATYVPALVAITQTSVIASRRRRLTVREAARIQGFPESFSFACQADASSYRQLGNAVHPGVVKHILRQHLLRDRTILGNNHPVVTSGLGHVLPAPRPSRAQPALSDDGNQHDHQIVPPLRHAPSS